MTDETPPTPGEGIHYTMRLQRYLARAGVASRRGAENLMTAGRVTVNGQVASELGCKVDPEVDVVAVDGQVVRPSDGSAYLRLNTPVGYVTTMSDPQGRPCVASLVPIGRYPGLFPVGRLDEDTTGLLPSPPTATRATPSFTPPGTCGSTTWPWCGAGWDGASSRSCAAA